MRVNPLLVGNCDCAAVDPITALLSNYCDSGDKGMGIALSKSIDGTGVIIFRRTVSEDVRSMIQMDKVRASL